MSGNSKPKSSNESNEIYKIIKITSALWYLAIFFNTCTTTTVARFFPPGQDVLSLVKLAWISVPFGAASVEAWVCGRWCSNDIPTAVMVKNLVTRGLKAPDKINIFSSSMQWILQPSRYFVNIAISKMAPKCREDGRQNPLSMVFAGDSALHHFQNFTFLKKSLILNFSVPWPTAWTRPCQHCSFSKRIDTLGWTTVGWVGHWCVSLHGHKWSLCTMRAAYQHLCHSIYMNPQKTYQVKYQPTSAQSRNWMV